MPESAVGGLRRLGGILAAVAHAVGLSGLLMLLGWTVLLYGLAQLSVVAAEIVAGAGLLALAALVAWHGESPR